MPLTKSGRKVMASMKKQYGKEKGERVFYASVNKGVSGSSEWEGKALGDQIENVTGKISLKSEKQISGSTSGKGSRRSISSPNYKSEKPGNKAKNYF